ncbi:MAG: ATPase [Candidatus Izimaplasma sp.]|nr:ATPase [Candidatus Izimaplasma bacterium]
MRYIIAYDGGGTKTHVTVVDLNGNIVFNKTTSGSNITSLGDVAFTTVIEGLYNDLKNSLMITKEDIELIYLGLSGADLKADYKRLYTACKPIFKEVKHIIVNDAWIILRSGVKKPYGAVAICGTGTNSAAINQQNERAILRALSYTLGTKGGGLDIARDALHYAYRADELTYQDTLLRTEIPKLFDKENLSECIDLFYPTWSVSKQELGDITALVNECALHNDNISNMILAHNAHHIALQTAGVMKQLKMTKDRCPVVVGGRVFQGKAPIFQDTFKKTIRGECPHITIITPKFKPVIGAYLSALDELGITQTKEIVQNLSKSGGLL